MPELPVQVPFSSAAGSLWRRKFRIADENGVVDLTGLTWQFVIRPNTTDTGIPAPVSVTTTLSTQGQITVEPLTGTVTVMLTPAATKAIGPSPRFHALWSNPGTDSELCWCSGNFFAQPVANP